VSPEWTVEEATELFIEQALDLLDGCDDDDTVRPQLVWEAICSAWSHAGELPPLEEVTAGEMRRRLRRARGSLAEGQRVP
jgi:hypothetical protein